MLPRLLAAGTAFLLAAAGASAQTLFKCGASYQDKPCAEADVQKRYAAGRFDVEQVNPEVDKDCARMAGELMPYWSRLKKGESIDRLRSEYDQKNVAKAEKSAMRDLLIALNGIEGTPKEARGQLETQCMADKRRKGLPTERELAEAGSSRTARVGEYEARRRAEQDRRRIRALCWQNYRTYNC